MGREAIDKTWAEFRAQKSKTDDALTKLARETDPAKMQALDDAWRREGKLQDDLMAALLGLMLGAGTTQTQPLGKPIPVVTPVPVPQPTPQPAPPIVTNADAARKANISKFMASQDVAIQYANYNWDALAQVQSNIFLVSPRDEHGDRMPKANIDKLLMANNSRLIGGYMNFSRLNKNGYHATKEAKALYGNALENHPARLKAGSGIPFPVVASDPNWGLTLKDVLHPMAIQEQVDEAAFLYGLGIRWIFLDDAAGGWYPGGPFVSPAPAIRAAAYDYYARGLIAQITAIKKVFPDILVIGNGLGYVFHGDYKNDVVANLCDGLAIESTFNTAAAAPNDAAWDNPATTYHDNAVLHSGYIQAAKAAGKVAFAIEYTGADAAKLARFKTWVDQMAVPVALGYTLAASGRKDQVHTPVMRRQVLV